MGRGDYTIRTIQKRRQKRHKRRMKRLATTKHTERAVARRA